MADNGNGEVTEAVAAAENDNLPGTGEKTDLSAEEPTAQRTSPPPSPPPSPSREPIVPDPVTEESGVAVGNKNEVTIKVVLLDGSDTTFTCQVRLCGCVWVFICLCEFERGGESVYMCVCL